MTSASAVNLAALGFGGIDTSTLVTSLVAIDQQPITQMTTDQQNDQAATTTLSNFSLALSALKNASVTLTDPTSFAAMKATSSDPSVVATATGTPPAGQWSVSVSSIAQEQRTLSNGQSSSSTALGLSGNLSMSIGTGTPTSIAIAPTDTLSDVANKISSAGLRVQASVMYDGSQYHLLVSGLDTGAANAITFNESGLSGTGPALGLSVPANTTQTAQDASMTVGGVSVTSPTNMVTNAIPGVTLALTRPTTTPTTISIAGDSSGLQTQVQAFVTAYNAVVTGGHTAAGYGQTAASNALLQGDSGIRSTLDQLSDIMGEEVPGSTGAYTTMASVGINLNADGTLAFDTTQFASALAADPASVTRLFVTDSSNGSTGLMSTLGSAVDSLTTPTTGAISAEIDAWTSRATDLTSRISDAQTRVTAYQTQLQTEFTQMNAMLAQYKQQSSALTSAFDSSSTSSSSSSSNSIP